MPPDAPAHRASLQKLFITGLLTLQDLRGAAEVDTAAIGRYVRSLMRDEGGFHGAAWDQAHDVEYSFYGLGCLALLAPGGWVRFVVAG